MVPDLADGRDHQAVLQFPQNGIKRSVRNTVTELHNSVSGASRNPADLP